MENYGSLSSLSDCWDYDKNEINLIKFTVYQHGLMSLSMQRAMDHLNHETQQSSNRRMKFKRKPYKKKATLIQYGNSIGVTVYIGPMSSSWYLQYIYMPVLSKSFYKQFRLRFRLPYSCFLELVDFARRECLFLQWQSKDGSGKASSPLELMILGSLRYLGRGWTFDDIEESTSISQETHRQFFHAFIEVGSTTFFNKYVVAPVDAQTASQHMHEFSHAGLNGAIGSTDATHIVLDKCSNRLKNAHMGGKLKYTARTYNITVNHRRRILSTTTGHPARWNDKTLIRFDMFAKGIRDGRILHDCTFNLLERKDKEVVTVSYNGVWLIVDNGYLSWPTTVPPLKIPKDTKEQRWSEWLESIRKDVECTFGIMKGRWRILKTGVRLHGIVSADKVWMTCCALHNWLLEEDGLDERWDHNVKSNWEGELGTLDEMDVCRYSEPFSLHRLRTVQGTTELRNHDTSGMGAGNDRDALPPHDDSTDSEDDSGNISSGSSTITSHTVCSDVGNNEVDTSTGTGIEEDSEHVSESSNVTWAVRDLTLSNFRDRLIEHFDILYERNEIVWPKHN
jgi:Plant transposon protein